MAVFQLVWLLSLFSYHKTKYWDLTDGEFLVMIVSCLTRHWNERVFRESWLESTFSFFFFLDLWESCGSIGRSIAGHKGNRESTRRPKESIHLDPWGLPETEPPTKEWAWAGPRPPAHMSQMCSLIFIWVPQILEQVLWLLLTLLPVCGSHFLNGAALPGLNEKGCT